MIGDGNKKKNSAFLDMIRGIHFSFGLLWGGIMATIFLSILQWNVLFSLLTISASGFACFLYFTVHYLVSE